MDVVQATEIMRAELTKRVDEMSLTEKYDFVGSLIRNAVAMLAELFSMTPAHISQMMEEMLYEMREERKNIEPEENDG